MSVDACLMEYSFSLNVSFLNLMAIQTEVCQMIVCTVFVNSPHYSNENNVELDFPVFLSI